MKRLVDLLRVNESRFTAIILGAMTIAAVINFNGQLGSGGGVPCLYDVYIIGILHVVDTFGVPLLLFYTLFVERHNQRIMQVVRERTVNDVWKRCVIDLLILCTFFTVYVFSLTTIVGLLRTNAFYNWGEQYSRCAKWLGKVCEEQPSFVMLLVAYVIETFQCFLITGIVMIGVWWCTNKEWAGYVSAIALITIDRSFESPGLIFGSYQVSSYTYKVGLNLGVNIIYPLIVMVIIFVLVNVAVRFKKKEFLGT